MEIKGKVVQKSDVTTGTSQAGKEWKKQEFVIEFQDGTMTKQLAFTCMGDKTELITPLKPGQTVTVLFNLESREYNGKYYTNATAWKIVAEEMVNAPVATGHINDLPF